MGSGAIIYIPCFINIGSGIRSLIRGDIQTCRQYRDPISLILFIQKRESRLKIYLFQYANTNKLCDYQVYEAFAQEYELDI
jgi:hypothetical protein